MWFGTEDGLNRFNGYSMRMCKHDSRDSSTVAPNGISDIYEESRNKRWIGAGNGLNLFDRHRERFKRLVSTGRRVTTFCLWADLKFMEGHPDSHDICKDKCQSVEPPIPPQYGWVGKGPFEGILCAPLTLTFLCPMIE